MQNEKVQNFSEFSAEFSPQALPFMQQSMTQPSRAISLTMTIPASRKVRRTSSYRV